MSEKELHKHVASEHYHEHSHEQNNDEISTQVEPHNHRAIIGFDKNGIPKVLVPVSGHTHTHTDENGNVYEHTHEEVFTEDYMKAVNAYRKTFPSKQDVLDNVPDPAVREMMLHMEQIGFDTTFDRFDKQQPQCSFGLSGTCCKVCNMGPCKITPKSPRGVCGADADLIVARNLLRGAAAGLAQHGMHARELILMLKWAAEGKDESVLDASLEWIHYDDLEITKESYEELAEKVKMYGINDKVPSYEDFIYQSE